MNQFFYQITRKASELINSDDYRKVLLTAPPMLDSLSTFYHIQMNKSTDLYKNKLIPTLL